jgi:Fur family iron response transcriptional regulator
MKQDHFVVSKTSKSYVARSHGLSSLVPPVDRQRNDIKQKLRQVGLRSTRQRIALGHILFGKGKRHVTAKMLYEEAAKSDVPVSLATIYNTLQQFTEAGLLRVVAVSASTAFFDTNDSEHHHFYMEDRNEVIDISSSDILLDRTPDLQRGM